MLKSLFENPFILFFSFLIVSSGVVFLSFLFSESIKSILARFQFSERFIGSSLLASGTSLPEGINALTAGIYDRANSSNGQQNSQKEETPFKYSLDSFYNLVGANLIQILFLTWVSLALWKLSKLRKFKEEERLKFKGTLFNKKGMLWIISTSELAIVLIGVIFPQAFKSLSLFGYSVFPCLFFLSWAIFLLFSKKKKSIAVSGELNLPRKSNLFESYSNSKFFSLFCCIFLCFIILAFLNFNIVSKFEKTFSIPKNIGLGTILSLITSFPEFSSFFFLFRAKHYELASAGFFGSALFNLMLPLITQLIKGDWLFSALASSDSKEQNPLIFWLSTILLINLCFALGSYTNSKGNFLFNISSDRWQISWGWVITCLYVLTSFIFFPIFFKGK